MRSAARGLHAGAGEVAGVTRPSWPLACAAEMRALDRYSIETLGVPGDVLMESAGRELAAWVLEELAADAEVCVVCGAGNNGGDGLVAARHLHGLGARVRAAVLAEAASLSEDAARNFERARALGVRLEGPDWEAPQRGVLVDAIFGTGLTRAVTGTAAESIERINAARKGSFQALRVLAVDLPSGLSADTGQEMGVAVAADATLTIGLPKPGLLLEPGRSRAGEVRVARIGIADQAPGTVCSAESLTRFGAAASLPERPRAGHKGSFGHVLIVAGSAGKSGAAALAAQGAGRMGAGLVTVACPQGIHAVLEVKCTEAMTEGLPETRDQELAPEAVAPILELAMGRDATGLGPGLGRGAATQDCVRDVVARLEAPLALDADGLVAFAKQPAALAERRFETLLTPHPGEAGMLLGSTPAQVNADRLGAARSLAERTGAVVLLKGAGSVIADPGGATAINPSGGPLLASGGTGDVLLGMVTVLLAQGLSAFEAARLGAYLHGAAADRLATRRGSTGSLAGEVAAEIPALLDALRELAADAAHGAAESSLVVPFPEP